MLIAFALTSSVNPKMTLLTVGVGCFIAPFAEEVREGRGAGRVALLSDLRAAVPAAGRKVARGWL